MLDATEWDAEKYGVVFEDAERNCARLLRERLRGTRPARGR
ncbi:hypothetical protein ACWCQS_12455 [Streptomyces sp. NPDC002076]